MKTREEILAMMENDKLLRKERLVDLWNNLGTFKEPKDVPNIPIVDKEEYEKFYIPRLIKAGAIQKKDLIDGEVYIGEHRIGNLGKWCADKDKFEYWRYKYGTRFIDDCNHFEDDDGYALFVPIKLGKKEDFK